MTEASGSKDKIEGTPDPAGGGLQANSLWGEVRYWVDAILSVFGDLKALAHVGATRSLAVKLCNWLWGVEGAIRRLILAEALKLDPAELGQTRPKTGAPTDGAARKVHRRRPSFRIFGFNRQGEAAPVRSSPTSAARSDLPKAWHIRFPSDPLLSIGERSSRRAKAASTVRRLNPLDRRGLSRSDPDYWLWREEEDYEASLLGLSSRRSPGRPSRPRPEPVLAQDRLSYLFHRGDGLDWRRVEEEWKRVIPAPHLAARIFALAGFMERRDQAVRRIASIFNRYRERIAAILAQPAPELAWPRRARSIYRSHDVETLVPRSHAELLRRDTS